MTDQITALLIGGANHGCVIKLYADLAEIEVAQRQRLKLILPDHVENDVAKSIPNDTYQRLTIDKNNRSIYVIKQENTTANDIFVDYMYKVFLKGAK